MSTASADLRTDQADPLHLIAALAAGGDLLACAASAGRGSPASPDRPDLIRLAQAHGLGPLLLSNLQRQTAPLPAPGAMAALQTERAEIAVHHLLAGRMQQQVARTFADAGAPCIWLKGIVLAHTVYPSPELRPMVDVDVLVPYARRRQALQLAQAAGFSLDSPQLFDGRDGLKHHYFLQNRAYHPISLELHFRLLGPLDRLLTVEDQEWFWQHTSTLDLANGDGVTVLQPEAHLLYLCAHAILQHGEAGLRLIHLYDLDRLLAATPGFDWNLLIHAAVRLRWTYAAERALFLAHDYFATPLPAQLLTELAARRPASERHDRALRRRAPQTATETVLDDLAQMGWSSRVRAAARIVAPPPSYMRWRYGLDSDRGLPRAYARRLRRITSDALYSMRRRQRGQR